MKYGKLLSMRGDKFQLSSCLVLYLILLSYNSESQCQDYIPFDFVNGTWITYETKKEIGSYKYQDYCIGDTIINNDFYHKLYRYTIETIYHEPPESSMRYVGAIANDTINKAINLIGSGRSDYTVIYNFNLEIGDTIKEGFGSEWYPSEPLIIEKIDTIEMCGKSHKRYITGEEKEWGIPCYIEGIGHSYGFLNPNMNPFESDTRLICYAEKENSNCEECDLLFLELAELELNNVNIFPNPSSGSMVLESDIEIESVEIFSLNGKLIFQDQVLSTQYSIDSNLEPGVYLIKLDLSNKKHLVQKIVIE